MTAEQFVERNRGTALVAAVHLVEGGWVVILQGHDSADRIRLLVQGDHYLPVASDNVLVAASPEPIRRRAPGAHRRQRQAL
jgi:hypothetical protein